MASPGSFAAGGVLTAAEMNALPGGVIAYSVVTSNDALSGVTGVTIHSLSVPTISGRQYAVFCNGQMSTFSAACEARIDVDINGGRTFIWRMPVAASAFHTYALSGIFDGTGSTLTVTVDASISTGTADHRGDSTFRATAFVVDLGDI